MWERIFNVVTSVTSVGALFFVGLQWSQANDHQKWGNYNEMNARYSALYAAIPPDLHFSRCSAFDRLGAKEAQWMRSYLDLYSEEHWLYQQGLMPEEMWTQRIDGGVDVNLVTYPVLVEGYRYWKAQGAFKHPADFIRHVDSKIAALRDRIEASRRAGCDTFQGAAETNPTIKAGAANARVSQPSPPVVGGGRGRDASAQGN